ncbi:MAG TPA: phosphomannose isomerase type II C-terminal cupin domain [Planctomycetota bacterium]|nr:phosphomannose isomerase type II C-terminal cupin domain [Planctomycetota bacterium]HRU51564.1 phosphomannose isomerase type II C-terminal cupin domain [Planctomycetota bacterium]
MNPPSNLPSEQCRPWGYYEILVKEQTYQVKKITVYPQQRISYQRHAHRTEHWYIISGQAIVVLNGSSVEIKQGNSIDIPIQAWHRIHNTTIYPLIFIEIQTGDYLGEDDIERLEDDYGRQ